MKITKRLALFLIFVLLLASLQSCSMPIKHYIASNKKDLAHCITVNYDKHVEYDEVISFTVRIAKMYTGGGFLEKNPISKEMRATVKIKDGEHYEVVGQNEYIIDDFGDKYYILPEEKRKIDEYDISLDFQVKITSPNYNLETLFVTVDYYHSVFNGIDYKHNLVTADIPVFKYISDDDGVIVHYFTGRTGYREIKSK